MNDPFCCDLHRIQNCQSCAAAQQRDYVKTLEARIADLEAKVLQLEHRTIGLEHRVNDGQRAHNVLASWTDIIEDSLRAMLAKLERPPR